MSKAHVVIPAITVVTGVNDEFALIEGPGYSPTTCTIPAGTYFARGDGAADDIFEVIKDLLNTNTTEGATYTVTTGASRAFFGISGTFNGSGGTLTDFDLAFAGSGAGRTFDGTLIGMNTTQGLDTEVGPTYGCKGVWVPDDVSEVFNEVPRALGSQFHAVGGQTYTHDRSGTTWTDREVVWPWNDISKVEESSRAVQYRTLYAAWQEWRKGGHVEIHELEVSGVSAFVAPPSSSTLVGTFVLDGMHLQDYQARRLQPGVPEYFSPLTLWREYVA